ncbi:MAG: hypothetical protein FJ312_10485 [SAR202 cluster bacterium]|nr:hypothetical protein [SAR202 cluster bacterium]
MQGCEGLHKAIRQFQLSSWDNWFPLTLIAVFVVLGAIVAAAGATFGLQPGDVDQFRGIYVDIGLQNTAGIFAIVISLSLVAIQFAAQEYSHRIMDYYIKSVMFWSTVVVYLGLMIACVLLNAGVSEGESLRVVSVIMGKAPPPVKASILSTYGDLAGALAGGKRKRLLRHPTDHLLAIAREARTRRTRRRRRAA